MTRYLILLFAVGLINAGAYAQDAEVEEDVHPISGREIAPVMGFGGAGWLERPSRIKEEKPSVVINAMELKGNETIADVGAGSGFFTRLLAKAVPDGKVFATDIQPEMIEMLKNSIEKEALTNVEPVLSEPEDTKLEDGTIDWILLVDVYHEIQDPQVMLKQMFDDLAPGGKVALVEYRLLGDTARHIKLEHRMSPKQVLVEWNAAGFELLDLIDELPAQHIFIFGKDPDRLKLLEQ